ncbi:uncharacterized protein LOC124538637 isoform X1 [Vanessa cardui]|uniref:uncharacterized protein LOC124538637 isoform X1 n=1 Tax=Vanessa cardui TaxID=171605 RepID=UPI001F137C35|nr:uncharacterized protein LOC124538637 isoform X1 [Vanessa cardui]
MSGKSYTSGSMRSCAGSVRLGTASGHEVVLDALYERKRDKKSVRVLTVIIYVFCVSLAAIMLSLYYVFFWEPKDAQYAQRKVSNTVTPQISTTPMPTCFMPHTGGSNTPVNQTAIPPSLDDYTNATNTNETTEATINLIENPTLPTSPKDNETSTTHPKLNHTDTLNLTTVT